MGVRVQTDPRVDDYVARAPAFARPILCHLRALVHAGCPGVEETIKWGRPFFMYREQVLGNMAAFKAHCAFGFWDAELRALIAREVGATADEAAGLFGKITVLADLPDDATLGRYLAEAVRRAESGRPAFVRPSRVAPRPEAPVPDDLAERLRTIPRAAAAFAKFPPGGRREYIEWITEAKRPETREKRLVQAVAWIAEGKRRHWQHPC